MPPKVGLAKLPQVSEEAEASGDRLGGSSIAAGWRILGGGRTVLQSDAGQSQGPPREDNMAAYPMT